MPKPQQNLQKALLVGCPLHKYFYAISPVVHTGAIFVRLGCHPLLLLQRLHGCSF
uniref:Uncharacterized protein n=1 Tax=Arundo donax TaxID=35708 RepID=A0A0A9HEP8_ARUDO